MSKKLKDQGLILPTPAKGKNRRMTIQLMCLFAIKIADEFIKFNSGLEGNKLDSYLIFLEKILKEKLLEIKAKSFNGTWEVEFDYDDIYKLEGKRAKIAEAEAIEKLYATNKFVKSTVRLFWDFHGSESNNLKFYINWLANNSKRI